MSLRQSTASFDHGAALRRGLAAAGLGLLGALAVLGAPASGAAGRAASTNLVADGGFESPHVLRKNVFDTYTAPVTMGAWNVSAGSVDLIDSGYWKPAGGTQSLDLSGNSAGRISQSIATQAGKRYTLTFSLATNVDGPPTVKRVRVSFGSESAVFSKAQAGATRTAMGWQTETHVFTAKAASTTLTFTSLSQTAFGPVLDNVTLTEG